MTIKPTASFKMSGPTKVALALGSYKDAHQRGAWKRAMIQAQLAQESASKQNAKSRKDPASE